MEATDQPFAPLTCNRPVSSCIKCLVGKKTGETDYESRRTVSLHKALLCTLIFSLVVTLATRTFHLTIPRGVTAQSKAAQAMRQHMDGDAAQWTPPVQILTTLQAPTFYPHVAPAGPPLGVLLLEESLYNRPPPSC
jgi:hypothetical protein